MTTARVSGPNSLSTASLIRDYVRDEIHTNTIEGHFSILKRGSTVFVITPAKSI